MIGNIAELKDIHKDERCFILGNARSLLQHDLLKLKNEYTFVTNLFPLHLQFADIKPSFYCMHDVWDMWEYSLGSQFVDALLNKSQETILFFPESHRIQITDLFPNRLIYFIKGKSEFIWETGQMNLDIVQGINPGGSIILDYCLPIAFYMGFSIMYLIGFDCDYIIEGDYQSNHFLGPMKKAKWIKDLCKWYDEELKHMLKSLEIIKEIFEADGRKIYNAGIGGKLEVFKRINYKDLF